MWKICSAREKGRQTNYIWHTNSFERVIQYVYNEWEDFPVDFDLYKKWAPTPRPPSHPRTAVIYYRTWVHMNILIFLILFANKKQNSCARNINNNKTKKKKIKEKLIDKKYNDIKSTAVNVHTDQKCAVCNSHTTNLSYKKSPRLNNISHNKHRYALHLHWHSCLTFSRPSLVVREKPLMAERQRNNQYKRFA